MTPASEEHGTSPFASTTLTGHLLRGGVAAGLIAFAIATNHELPALAVIAGIGAIIALRGCPMCWTMGLLETLHASRRTMSERRR